MISLPPIGRDALLRVIAEVRRRRAYAVLEALEATHADLVEHVLDELLAIDDLLIQAGVSGRRRKRVLRHARNLAVVMLLAGQSGSTVRPELN